MVEGADIVMRIRSDGMDLKNEEEDLRLKRSKIGKNEHKPQALTVPTTATSMASLSIRALPVCSPAPINTKRYQPSISSSGDATEADLRPPSFLLHLCRICTSAPLGLATLALLDGDL